MDRRVFSPVWLRLALRGERAGVPQRNSRGSGELSLRAPGNGERGLFAMLRWAKGLLVARRAILARIECARERSVMKYIRLNKVLVIMKSESRVVIREINPLQTHITHPLRTGDGFPTVSVAGGTSVTGLGTNK